MRDNAFRILRSLRPETLPAEETKRMDEFHPGRIVAIGAGYMASKVLLSALGLGLFTALGERAMSATAPATRVD